MTGEPSPESTRTPPVAVALAVVGGLVLVGATSANWVAGQTVRDVGGVELVVPQGTIGSGLAAQGVAAGVLAVLAGLALAVARGRVRRLIGGLLLLTGLAAGVVVIIGLTRGLSIPGHLTPAPWMALGGAVTIGAAGLLAWRRPSPQPVLGERYTLEGDEAADDREWRLASSEDVPEPNPDDP